MPKRNRIPPPFLVVMHGPAAKTQTAFIDEDNAPAGLTNLGPPFYVDSFRKGPASVVAVHGVHNGVGGPFARTSDGPLKILGGEQ